MQSYSAPLNDMKFIIEDFLNSGAADTLFKQNETNTGMIESMCSLEVLGHE